VIQVKELEQSVRLGLTMEIEELEERTAPDSSAGYLDRPVFR